MVEYPRVTIPADLCASCGKPLPVDEPAYLAADGRRAHISENPDHQLMHWQKVGDPIYGIPHWRCNERGEPTGEVDPTPSPNATITCSCGLMVVATTNSSAANAYRKHIANPDKTTDAMKAEHE